jgi:hypothetical protein
MEVLSEAIREFEERMFPRAGKEAARTKMQMEGWFEEGAAEFLVGLVKKYNLKGAVDLDL